MTTKIKVYEGLDGECINLKAIAPPSTFCNGTDDCQYRIGYKFTDTTKYTYSRCADEDQIPQAMFEYVNGQSCQLTINDSNWQTEACVKVRGIADGLKDKKKKLHVDLQIYVETTTTVIYQATYSSVEVGPIQIYNSFQYAGLFLF